MERNVGLWFAGLSVADNASGTFGWARGKVSQCKLKSGVKGEGTKAWRGLAQFGRRGKDAVTNGGMGLCHGQGGRLESGMVGLLAGGDGRNARHSVGQLCWIERACRR